MESLRERLAIGVFWTVFLRVSTRVVGLASTLILVRILAPSDFGIVALGVTAFAILNAFTEFGPELYLISNQNAGKADYDTAWTFEVIRGLTIAAVIALLSEPIAHFFNQPPLRNILLVLSIGVALRGMANVAVVDFRKNLEFRKDFLLLLTPRLFSFVVTITIAAAYKSYWALVIGLLVNQIVYVCASFFMHNYRPQISFAAFSRMFNFSKWMFATSALQFLTQKIDTLIIGKVLGTRTLGLYGISYEISSLATTELAAPIRRAMLPGYSKVAGNLTELKRLYLDVFALTVMLTIPAAVGIALTSDLIVLSTLGRDWSDAIPIIEVLAFCGALQAIGSGAEPLFVSIGKPRLVTATYGATLLIQVPLMLFAIKSYGIIGVAWALVISWALRQIFVFHVLTGVLGTRILEHMSCIWRSIAAVGVLSISVIFTRQYLGSADGSIEVIGQLLICIAMGVFAYTGAHLSLWQLSGRPKGPETQLMKGLTLLTSKINWRGALDSNNP